MKYTQGKVYRFSKASAQTMKVWRQYNINGLNYLICPCNIKGRFVELQVKVQEGYWIVITKAYLDEPNFKPQLTIVNEKELS